MPGLGLGLTIGGKGGGSWISSVPEAQNAHLYFSPATGHYAKNGAPVGFSQMGTFEAAGTRFEEQASGLLVPRGVDVPRLADYSKGARRWLMEGTAENDYPNPTSPEDWTLLSGVVVDGNRVSESTGNSTHRAGQSPMSIVNDQEYTLFYRFKPSPSLRYCGMRVNWASDYANVGFDLQTMTVTYADAAYSAGIYQDAGGYVVIYATAVSTKVSAFVTFFFADAQVNDNSVVQYIGDPDRYIDMSYGQMHRSGYVSSLIDGVATRAPEFFSRDVSGMDLSGGVGVFFSGRLDKPSSDTTSAVVTLAASGTNTLYLLRYDNVSGNLQMAHRTDGTTEFIFNSPYTLGEPFKIGALFGQGASGAVFAHDGVIVANQDTVNFAQPAGMLIGVNAGGSGVTSGVLHIGQAELFDFDLYSPAELQVRTAA